jgi:choline dehydrogenase-like flavoprotein
MAMLLARPCFPREDAMTRDLSADVVVIGAGPAGAALTWKLASLGVDVLCLERGEWFDYRRVSRDDPDYELRRRGALNANPNVRRGPADEPIDDADSPIKPLIGNAVGGGSVWWSSHVPRFRPDDFDVRSRFGVAADWPLGHAELDLFYAENERMIGAAFVAGDPTGPARQADGAPLPPIGAQGRRMAAAFERLGWHWWPVDLVNGRGDGVCTHAGPCDLGCPARRRQGADRIYVEAALEKGARLATGLRVQRLEHDAAGRVTEARAIGPEGPLRVRGRAFVVAANGLGTPHLLLRSASDRFPQGLGNGSGLVGRGLMLHPYGRVDGRFAEPLGFQAPGETAGLISFEFQPTRPERGFLRGAKLQVAPGPGPLALANGAPDGVPLPWGAEHHAAMEARFDRWCGVTVCAEDLPEDDNRVVLSDRMTDRDGLPALKMVYRLSDNSRRILDHGIARATEVLREAGAVETHVTPLRDQAGFHLMGTARMGNDPARSVVDAEGRCHDVDNLFVADSSVFVTSSVCNPTATAQALALRSACAIAGQLARPAS